MDLTKFGFSVNKSSQKKEESDDKKEKKKEYEKKRKRKFQETWIVEYPGLVYEKFISSEDEREAKMFCSICHNNKVTADKSCSMFMGTNAFRKDTLVSHWKSQKKLKDYPFLYMSFFMLDVFKTLSLLSLKVQKDNITLSHFLESVHCVTFLPH